MRQWVSCTRSDGDWIWWLWILYGILVVDLWDNYDESNRVSMKCHRAIDWVKLIGAWMFQIPRGRGIRDVVQARAQNPGETRWPLDRPRVLANRSTTAGTTDAGSRSSQWTAALSWRRRDMTGSINGRVPPAPIALAVTLSGTLQSTGNPMLACNFDCDFDNTLRCCGVANGPRSGMHTSDVKLTAMERFCVLWEMSPRDALIV